MTRFFSSLLLLLLWAGGARAVEDAELLVRANQLGYRSAEPKVAVAFARAAGPETFRVLRAGSETSVLERPAIVQPGMKWGQFGWFAELDFTAVSEPGEYQLAIGNARSLPFVVGDDVFAALPDQLLEFMRQQRCGYNPWLQVHCHMHDGASAYGPEPAGIPVAAVGGWHDAADLLKYLLTSSNATAQLLLAALLQKQQPKETSGQLALADRCDPAGNPGPNGISDLLDEARWGLEWMLKLHPLPDQLYHQVADDRDHAGWRLPHQETVDYGWGAGGARVVYFADGKPQGLKSYKSESTGVANLAGRYAAAMGLAFQLKEIWPEEFTKRCLRAGEEVYRLGKASEGVQQGNSYSAPYRYEESTWADDMEWGAAELYRATGKASYLADAKRYAEIAGSTSWMGQKEIRHYQYYPFMNLGHFRLHDLVDQATQARLAGYYRTGIGSCRQRAEGNPFRAGMPFIWCSNNLCVALATQCLCEQRMTDDRQFQACGVRQRDWLLGCNPWGYAMFTEIGTKYPRDVHLMTTRLTKRTVRGGLVDGPVAKQIFQNLRGVSIREPDPLAAFQDEQAVYHDDFGDYSTNEPTMDGTASAILLWVMSWPQSRRER